MSYLLVLPKFPIPSKSRYHKNYFPIGLLKIGRYLLDTKKKVKFVIGFADRNKIKFKPTHIYITSFFTYWAEYVKETVEYYRNLFPDAKIIVGGIYASLMPDHCLEFTGCDEVFTGRYKNLDDYKPSYDLFYKETKTVVNYNIVWTTKGCIKKCNFCGVWKIEPEFIEKDTIKNELTPGKRIVVFYDNNILANRYIEKILRELIELKGQRKILYCEAQCGLDLEVLLKKPQLAFLLKKAFFKNIKIAWDGSFSDEKKVKKALDILVKAGFDSKEIGIFMIYNYRIPFKELELKRKKCWEWKVQIIDCRYRPLDNPFNNIVPYINANWTKTKIKQFRKNVRRQNICVRFRYPIYVRAFEKKKIDMKEVRKIKNTHELKQKINLLNEMGCEVWNPIYSWK